MTVDTPDLMGQFALARMVFVARELMLTGTPLTGAA